MSRRRAGWFGAVSFLLLSGLVAGAATPIARSMVIVPAPRDVGVAHVPEFSRAAAERVREEIGMRGFAAIVPKSRARPERIVVADEVVGDADLYLFVWIEQIDVGEREGVADSCILTRGGLELRDRSDQRLAYRSGQLGKPGEPSNRRVAVARADDPVALAAADEYGHRVLSAVREYSKKVGPLVGGGC